MKRILSIWLGISERCTSLFNRPNASLSTNKPEYFIKRGWKILVGGLGFFLIWASFAPLDRGVTVSAFVISDGERKAVQSLSGGMIDKILVKEGSLVKAGEPIVLMNAVNQTSKEDSNVTAIATLNESIKLKEQQLRLLNQQVSNINSLAREGYVAKNRALELERSKYQLQESLASDQGRRNELLAQLPAARFELQNTEIKAPVDGYVVGLSVFTNGGVVAPGAKLMEIAPLEAPLIVSGELPINLVDKVHPGLPVNMQFTAFNQNRTPHIPGVLTLVGSDRLVDEKSGVPYYRVQALATSEGMTLLGNHKVRAGMPVELFIKTGERSLMSYLLKPILDRAHSALRED